MRAYAITDVGSKRSMNQDFFYCNENAVGSFRNLFIVADGMGGHKAGTMLQSCVWRAWWILLENLVIRHQ